MSVWGGGPFLRPSWRGDMVGKMTCFIKCYKYEVLNLDTQYHTFKKKKVKNSSVCL